MTYPDVTMTKCSDGDSPQYDCKYTDGNRPKISSFSGTISNGSTLTLNGFFSAKRNGQLFTMIASPAQAGMELVPSYVASTADSWLGSGASIVAQTTAGSSWKTGASNPTINHETISECYYSLMFKADMINYGLNAEGLQIKFERPMVYTGHTGMIDQILFYNETGSGAAYGNVGTLGGNWAGNSSGAFCTVNNAGLAFMFNNWCKKIGYYKPNQSGKKNGSVYHYVRDETTKSVLFNFIDTGIANANDQRYTTSVSTFAEPVYYFDDNGASSSASQFWLPFFKRNSAVFNMYIDALIANDSPEAVWLINGTDIDLAFNTGKSVHIPQLTRNGTQITATCYLGDLTISDNIYAVVFNSNGRASVPVLVRAAS